MTLILRASQENYPDNLAHCFLFPVGWLINSLLGVCRPLLDKDTASKMSVLTEVDVQQGMRQHFEDGEIEIRLGGTLDLNLARVRRVGNEEHGRAVCGSWEDRDGCGVARLWLYKDMMELQKKFVPAEHHSMLIDTPRKLAAKRAREMADRFRSEPSTCSISTTKVGGEVSDKHDRVSSFQNAASMPLSPSTFAGLSPNSKAATPVLETESGVGVGCAGVRHAEDTVLDVGVALLHRAERRAALRASAPSPPAARMSAASSVCTASLAAAVDGAAVTVARCVAEHASCAATSSSGVANADAAAAQGSCKTDSAALRTEKRAGAGGHVVVRGVGRLLGEMSCLVCMRARETVGVWICVCVCLSLLLG